MDEDKKKHVKIIQNIWYIFKRSNIQIIGAPEENEKKHGAEAIFEEMITEKEPQKTEKGHTIKNSKIYLKSTQS